MERQLHAIAKISASAEQLLGLHGFDVARIQKQNRRQISPAAVR